MHVSSRVKAFELETNEEGMRLVLDLIDKVRVEAYAKIVEFHKQTSFYYNLRFKIRAFKEGDLVLRRVEASCVGQKGKLAPNWERPYKFNGLQGLGAYKLEIIGGEEVSRT